jgi:hypothetical protein
MDSNGIGMRRNSRMTKDLTLERLFLDNACHLNGIMAPIATAGKNAAFDSSHGADGGRPQGRLGY